MPVEGQKIIQDNTKKKRQLIEMKSHASFDTVLCISKLFFFEVMTDLLCNSLLLLTHYSQSYIYMHSMLSQSYSKVNKNKSLQPY